MARYTILGVCLALALSAAALAQRPAAPAIVDSPMENPFGDQAPNGLQPPMIQFPAGQPPYPAPASPVVVIQAAPQQSPPPATLAELLFADGRNTPSDDRCGSFQKVSLVNTYLPRLGNDGFGWYDLELTSVWGLPCPSKDAPLVITPGFATHWLDGPPGLDIPPQLHDLYTEFRWLPKIGDRFRADIAVEPGYFSAWDGSTVRGVRILGHGAGIYDWTPTLQIVLGCAYLDRPDIELLPIAGIIWKPDADAEYRLVFPQPKISWRLGTGSVTINASPAVRNFENWLYVGGELGGGTWAIRHSDGASDLMSYSDIRVYVGIETRSITTVSSHIELGYVFNRYIRLQSIGSNYDVGDTLMARAGVNY